MAKKSAHFLKVKNNQTSIEVQLPPTQLYKEDMKLQLQNLGIKRGMLILVNADTSRFGYMIGGVQALIEALMEAVGYEGTIVMPTFTPRLADPACQKGVLERNNWKEARKYALPFHKKLSEPTDCDELVHQFLRNEGVLRSYHPLYSFAAWGKYAKLICDKHPLHFGLGQESPLGKIVEFNGYCVLLGCEFEACTMFQLSRYNGEQMPIKIISAPIENNKKLCWKDMLDLQYDHKNFSDVGEVMVERHIIRESYMGNGRMKFFSAREAVTLATAYFQIHKD